MDTESTIRRLADHLGDFLCSGAEPSLGPLVSKWPPAPYRYIAPVHWGLSVMRYLDAASAMEESARAGLIDDLRTAAPTLHWRQTYTHEAVGASFLEKYGWTAVVGSQGPIVSHEIWAGFLLLGPGLEYPVHHHEPEELYRVVSGNGLWKVGDGPWSPRGAGARIHNPPHQPHGMRADADAPLVIAFLVDMTEPFVSSFDTP